MGAPVVTCVDTCRSGVGTPMVTCVDTCRSGVGAPVVMCVDTCRSGVGAPVVMCVDTCRSSVGAPVVMCVDTCRSGVGAPVATCVDTCRTGVGAPVVMCVDTCRSGVGAPVVTECDGDYHHDGRHNVLEWTLAVIDESSKTGSLEFTIAGHPNDFFPVNVKFISKKLYCDIKVRVNPTVISRYVLLLANRWFQHHIHLKETLVSC